MDFGSEREESEDGRVALSLRRGPPLCNRDHGKDQRAQASGRAMEWNGMESNRIRWRGAAATISPPVSAATSSVVELRFCLGAWPRTTFPPRSCLSRITYGLAFERHGFSHDLVSTILV